MKTYLSKELIFEVTKISTNLKGSDCFLSRYNESIEVIKDFTERGYSDWVITFSGGKDSTATLITALETALLIQGAVNRIDVFYADTGLEIPLIHTIRNFQGPKNLSLEVKIVRLEPEESFWACLIGKSYPPPHQKFRWCTKRLKIAPVEKVLKTFKNPLKTSVIIVVRFNQSKDRNMRLVNPCSRGGEYGQGVWFQHSLRLNVGYLAPVIDWSDCEVWYFLNIYAPSLGFTSEKLEPNVNNGRRTRFGCWLCKVGRQYKALKKIISLFRWDYLRPLIEFRKRVVGIAYLPSSHIKRRKEGIVI